MVTIGLPFFNAQATLGDAIRSVFAQSITNWELILVDDGSSDKSLEIARSVVDPRVTVITDSRNVGLSARLNQIASLAHGEYLARLDSDDLLHPDRLARQISILESRPAIDLVGTAMYSLECGDKPRGLREVKPAPNSAFEILERALLYHATVTGRTKWFLDHPYDQKYYRAEDRELWVRTHQELAFTQLEDPLYFCREEQSINLPKYLASGTTERMVFRRYGPALVGGAKTAELCLRSFLKGMVYRAFSSFDAVEYLVRRRGPRLSQEEEEKACMVLARIKNTPVSGLACI
jgi:glycosyltransferase involved in cell wall biosynthesis